VTLTRPTSIAGHAGYSGPFTVKLRLTTHRRRGFEVDIPEIRRRVTVALIGKGFGQDSIEVEVDQEFDYQALLTIRVWPDTLPAHPVDAAIKVQGLLSAATSPSESITFVSVDPPLLRFRVTRAAQPSPEFANWYVVGSEDDWSGDPIWGHFTTWQEAMDYACQTLTLNLLTA